MKLRLLACLLTLSLLGGCSRNIIYSDYREIDQLELVQTLGVDRNGELVTATASTAAMEGPLVLKNTSVTVSRAMREMQDYTSKKYIFYGHTKHLLVGEAAAEKSLSLFLEHMERSVEMRLDTELYIVQGGRAEDIIASVGQNGTTAGDLLDSLAKDVELMSESHVFTCGEVAEMLASRNCGVAAAIVLAEEPNIMAGAEKSTIQSSGYALLRDEKLVGFLDVNLSRGANLLMDLGGSDVVEVPDDSGGWAAVRLTKSDVKYEADFRDGGVSAVRVQVEISGNLDELQNPMDVYSAENIAHMEKGLEDIEGYRVRMALKRAQELGADFYGIGKQLSMKYPLRYERLSLPWSEAFPGIPFTVEVQAKLVRTYDVGRSAIRNGLEKGA